MRSGIGVSQACPVTKYKVYCMVQKQPWMAKGNAVLLPTGKGIVETVVECQVHKKYGKLKKKMGEHTEYLGEHVTMVMQLYVRPDGVLRAWPYNPQDVSEVKQATDVWPVRTIECMEC
jgi:hypothetical protein